MPFLAEGVVEVPECNVKGVELGVFPKVSNVVNDHESCGVCGKVGYPVEVFESCEVSCFFCGIPLGVV